MDYIISIGRYCWNCVVAVYFACAAAASARHTAHLRHTNRSRCRVILIMDEINAANNIRARGSLIFWIPGKFPESLVTVDMRMQIHRLCCANLEHIFLVAVWLGATTFVLPSERRFRLIWSAARFVSWIRGIIHMRGRLWGRINRVAVQNILPLVWRPKKCHFSRRHVQSATSSPVEMVILCETIAFAWLLIFMFALVLHPFCSQ